MTTEKNKLGITAGGIRYYSGDIIPERDVIFVFGSNPEGRHGAGAAKTARELFGAIHGVGEGLQGNAYALPTKDLRVRFNRGLRSIPKYKIIESIRKLYGTAKRNPDKLFLIAYRNTHKASLNGYSGIEMMGMFNEARTGFDFRSPEGTAIPRPYNVIVSKEWAESGFLTNTR